MNAGCEDEGGEIKLFPPIEIIIIFYVANIVGVKAFLKVRSMEEFST